MVDQCCYGLSNPLTNGLWQKPTWIIFSDAPIQNKCDKQCPNRVSSRNNDLGNASSHVHETLEGTLHGVKKTSIAEAYPIDLAKAILDSANILRKRGNYQQAYPALARNSQKGEPRLDDAETPLIDDKELTKVLHSIRRGWSLDTLREDQKTAIQDRFKGFSIRCAQGARNAAAFRTCSTKDKACTHRVTYASWRPENGTVAEERWYRLSGVEAMTETNGNKLLPWTSYRLVTFFGVLDQAGGEEPAQPGEKPTGDSVDPDMAFEDLTWVFDKGESVSWLGLKPGASRSDMENLVRHIHSLSGHSSPKEMVQILKDAGAAGPLIEVARTTECPLCQAMKHPRQPRAMNLPPKAKRFNEIVHMDFFHVTVQTDTGPKKYLLISMLDE